MLLALALLTRPLAAAGGDEEGCLLCHGHPLRQHPAAGRPDLRVEDPPGALHASLFCSDCHPDARSAPHPARPGPASCIGECHGGPAERAAAHRRASFGGLTEVHRALSAPAAPCLLCHRQGDRPGGRAPLSGRCEGCHPAQKAASERGVHARAAAGGGAVDCARCHRAHRADRGNAPVASCDGTGCHGRVDEGMRALAAHDGSRRAGGGPGGLAAGLVFVAIVGAGWLGGRLLGAVRGGVS